MRRREFISVLGGTATAWPLGARAQPTVKPVIGYIGFGALENSVLYLAAFRRGLGETGLVEGQNVAIEYRWLEGRYERMPEVTAELTRSAVAVIATPGTPPSAVRAAMVVTATIPIVFGVGDDPVKWGIVAGLGKPNSNATGINFFVSEVVAKRLELLRELVPGAARIAVLLNSADPARSESTLKDVQAAANTLALQVQSSMPAPATRSRPLSPRSRASAPTRCSSAPMASSIPAVSSSRCWQRDMRFPRPLRCANMPTPAG
jgi:putative tryptophan/tyrosine transport system substrate-binding protein